MARLNVDSSNNSIQLQYGKMRGPETIMFDITQRCNMRCMHCYNYSNNNYDQDLCDSDMMKTAEQIVEVKPCVVCLCGGEPTVRLDLCLKIAKLLTTHGISVNMVSNGLLLTKENIVSLFDSGIKNIQISLDSHKEDVVDTFRGTKGAYSAAIAAIDNVLELGKVPTVTFIPTKINYKDVGGLVDLLYSKGIVSVRYMPFIPLGRGMNNLYPLKMTAKENEELYWIIHDTKIKYPEFDFDYGDPLEHIYLFRTNPVAVTPMYEIKSNGDVQLTPYIPYIYGNVKDYTLTQLWKLNLRDIWRSPSVQEVAQKINTLDDIENQQILPYQGKDIDLMKEVVI